MKKLIFILSLSLIACEGRVYSILSKERISELEKKCIAIGLYPNKVFSVRENAYVRVECMTIEKSIDASTL